MKKHTRWALAIVVLAAVAVAAASAMAFAGRDASATRSDNVKARSSISSADDAVRAERRESFSHTGCSKRTERASTPAV